MIAVLAGCDKTRRSPGRAYMPDMSYSRAYDAYSSTENLKEHGINYNAMPVVGAVARGDEFPYTLKNDLEGYAQSASVKSPLDASKIDMTEAERLYLVNCGVCHGTKLMVMVLYGKVVMVRILLLQEILSLIQLRLTWLKEQCFIL